jgi:hypothetical protein
LQEKRAGVLSAFQQFSTGFSQSMRSLFHQHPACFSTIHEMSGRVALRQWKTLWKVWKDFAQPIKPAPWKSLCSIQRFQFMYALLQCDRMHLAR